MHPVTRLVLEQVAAARNGQLDGDTVVFANGVGVQLTSFVRTSARFLVRAKPPGVPTFTLKRGSGEIELGNELDFRFAIETDEPAALRQLWTSTAIRIMCDDFPNAVISARDDILELVADVERDAQPLIRGVDMLAELANADPYRLAILRGLPGVTSEQDGVVRFAGPGDIRAGIHRARHRAVTWLRAAVECDLTRPLPAEIDGAKLRTSRQRTTVVFPTLVHERRRLLTALAFLREQAATGSQGAYR